MCCSNLTASSNYPTLLAIQMALGRVNEVEQSCFRSGVYPIKGHPKVQPHKGVCREMSWPWGILEIQTLPSGNRHTIAKNPWNKRTGLGTILHCKYGKVHSQQYSKTRLTVQFVGFQFVLFFSILPYKLTTMSPKSSELDKYRVESRTLNSYSYALRAKTCACFDSSQFSSCQFWEMKSSIFIQMMTCLQKLTFFSLSIDWKRHLSEKFSNLNYNCSNFLDLRNLQE